MISQGDYCEALQLRARSFPEKVFGNSRWSIVAGRKPTDMYFFTPPQREQEGLFREQLFRFRCSFVLPCLEQETVYRPDVYGMEHRTPQTTAKTALVFPPDRYGAIMYVDGAEGIEIASQIHLFTWSESDPDPVMYPDYDAATRTFSFRKHGITVKLQLHFEKEPSDFRVNNGWQAARIGVRTKHRYAVLMAFGLEASDVDAELQALEKGLHDWRTAGTRWWNDYFASCPLVKLKEEIEVKGLFPGESKKVVSHDFVLRQLWMYYWALLSVIEVSWARATPLQLADRLVFNQSFSNDNTFGIELLALTNQRNRGRAHLVNLVRYLIDSEGHLHWSISVHGTCSTFTEPHGIPAIAHAVGHYVRCTGDLSILDAEAGGMTLWEKLRLYYRKVIEQRDTNRDGLIEWNHIWETGEDNKNSPFFKKKGLLDWLGFYRRQSGKQLEADPFYRENACPVTSLNEQTFHLWALGEMARLAEQKEDKTAAEAYRTEAEQILQTVLTRHWNEIEGFYYDYDVRAGALWTAKNLSAFYGLYFERDARRVERMLQHLRNPGEFALALLPSLSADDPEFDPESYWSGAAWPREQGFVAIGLAKQGFIREAFDLIVKAIASEEGMEFAETANPLCWPVESHSPIAMTMCAVNQVILLDLCGFRTWDGPVRVEETVLPVTLVQTGRP